LFCCGVFCVTLYVVPKFLASKLARNIVCFFTKAELAEQTERFQQFTYH
jgi:hypothetical protein